MRCSLWIMTRLGHKQPITYHIPRKWCWWYIHPSTIHGLISRSICTSPAVRQANGKNKYWSTAINSNTNLAWKRGYILHKNINSTHHETLGLFFKLLTSRGGVKKKTSAGMENPSVTDVIDCTKQLMQITILNDLKLLTYAAHKKYSQHCSVIIRVH